MAVRRPGFGVNGSSRPFPIAIPRTFIKSFDPTVPLAPERLLWEAPKNHNFMKIKHNTSFIMGMCSS
jgi:hypothetical protein